MKHKILIIEDDTLMQEILVKRLNADECGIARVGLGLEGIEKAVSWQPDLIISNVGSMENMKKALNLGANDYFVKANAFFFSIVGMVKQYLIEVDKQK
jgi:DNA-binding response OmpR family regulator